MVKRKGWPPASFVPEIKKCITRVESIYPSIGKAMYDEPRERLAQSVNTLIGDILKEHDKKPVREESKPAESLRAHLIEYVAARTRTFGGGRGSDYNPLTEALKDKPASFAAGVDVGEVIDLVFQGLEDIKNHAQDLIEAVEAL